MKGETVLFTRRCSVVYSRQVIPIEDDGDGTVDFVERMQERQGGLIGVAGALGVGVDIGFSRL